VLWGAYYGLLLMLFRLVPALKWLSETDSRGRVIASTLLMFGLTLIGWAIFRSRDIGQLSRWFLALGQWHNNGAIDWVKPALWWVLHATPLLLLQTATWKTRDEVEFGQWAWPVRGLAYAVLFLAVATSAVSDVEFIYFQF
jgi:hypothetical protein